MGHPKKQRRKYERPKRPYDKERIEKEKALLKEFGLRRKNEIWRAESILRNFRRRARDLQAKEDEKKTKELMGKLGVLGLLSEKSGLEDVLGLKIEDVLSRRLQTLVHKKGVTAKHARQLIVHGHVKIDDRKARWPSYLVPVKMESKIMLNLKKEVESA